MPKQLNVLIDREFVISRLQTELDFRRRNYGREQNWHEGKASYTRGEMDMLEEILRQLKTGEL